MSANLRQLIDAYCHGTATDAQLTELADLLRDDADARRAFAQATDLHAALRWRASGTPQPVVTPTASPKSTIGNRQSAISSPIPFVIYPIAIAAAALLTAAIVVVYLLAFTTPADPQPDPIKPNTPGPSVATLIENTGDLQTPHGFPAEGEDFSAGEYTLSNGTAEFMLTNAVNVKLQGDSRLFMRNDMNVALTRGSADFVVPKDAKGFTVHLPDESKIVDLGTAFRVEVDDDGETKLRVTQGSVQWTPAGEKAEPVFIVAGQTARIVEGRVAIAAPPLFAVDFEDTIQPGDDGTITKIDGTFTETGWPNTGFAITGVGANTLMPASASAWMNPVPQDLGETFGALHAGGSATAVLDEAFSANTMYTLTFTQLRRDDLASNRVTAMILAADGTELARETFPAVTAMGAIETRKLVYTTSADGPEIGGNIQFRFVAATGNKTRQQVGIDNISLDATASPQTLNDNRQRVGDKP